MRLVIFRNARPISEVELMAVDRPDATAQYHVGRSKDCQIALDSPRVSRYHAVIECKRGKWFLRNTSGYAEVYVNGNSVTDSLLESGDIIRIDPFTIEVGPGTGTRRTAITKSEKVDAVVDASQVDSAPEVKAEDALLELSPEMPDHSQDFQGNNEPQESGTDKTVSDASFGENTLQSSGNADNTFKPTSQSNDDGTRMVKAFVVWELEIVGQYAPYDRFTLKDPEVFIGRNPQKCQICLKDTLVSQTHAVLKREEGAWYLEDLRSANGTIFNGSKINKTELQSGDEFVIGETSFTFHATSPLLVTEKERLMPVEENQEIEVQEIVEVGLDLGKTGQMSMPAEEKGLKGILNLFSKESLKDPAKRKKLLIYAIGLLLLWYFLGSNESPTVKADKSGKVATTTGKSAISDDPLAHLTEEQKRLIAANFELALKYVDQGEYGKALAEIDNILLLAPKHTYAIDLRLRAKRGVDELKAIDDREREERARRESEKRVADLLIKAREAVKDHQSDLAESLFLKIKEDDPENLEIQILASELMAWVKEQERIKAEILEKETRRKAEVAELGPGKSFYLQGEWYKATVKLEEYLMHKDYDEDLIKEAATMLGESKKNLDGVLSPVLAKARSFIEAKNLKEAYETYLEALKIHPAQAEALSEMENIRSSIEQQASRLYREALISESLGLFADSKKKLHEVLETTPSDNDYFEKATNRLKDYFE